MRKIIDFVNFIGLLAIMIMSGIYGWLIVAAIKMMAAMNRMFGDPIIADAYDEASNKAIEVLTKLFKREEATT